MGDPPLHNAQGEFEAENKQNDLERAVSVMDGGGALDRRSQYLRILIMWELSVSCQNNQDGLICHIDTPCVDTITGYTHCSTANNFTQSSPVSHQIAPLNDRI